MGENQRVVFVNNLIYYMKVRGIEQSDIVAALGVSTSTVSDWVKGKKYPRVDAMQRLADYLGVLLSDLTSESETKSYPNNIIPISDLHRQRVPLIGKVAAGQPIMADEDYETYVSAPVDCDVALEVQGDSMEPTYLSGDIVYIRRQDQVDDGQVAVVILDDSATLKHVYHDRNGVTLISDNPKYAPMHFTGDDCSYMAVYGIPVGYTRMYRRRKRT